MPDIDKLLVCDCGGTMALDPDKLGAAAGATHVKACSFLCGDQLEIASNALASEGTTLIACGQEAPLFEDLADEMDGPAPLLTLDIRDRAGWTSDENAHAKQAAILAAARLPLPQTPVKDVTIDGVCLVLGRGDVALNAAKRLSGSLAVTCLLPSVPDMVLPVHEFDLALGSVSSLTGAAGNFSVTVDGYAPLQRAGRGDLSFAQPRDGAKSNCDIIVDLRGEAPLVSAPEKRDGYLRADPKDPAGVAAVLLDAAQLLGTFEKPLYVRFDASICAHSRASKSGCNRCLHVCPTGAISPHGDHVSIDPDICAGCGSCAAVCPSGAASYDDPSVDAVFRKMRALASGFDEAGGNSPRLLFHDREFGTELMQLSARYGRGLPADVIPLDVNNVEGVGHAEIVAAFGVGFDEVLVLTSPKTDTTVLEAQMEIARAILDGTGLNAELTRILRTEDPSKLEDILHDQPVEPLLQEPILPLGSRRDVTRLAAQALANAPARDGSEKNIDGPIPLPEGAIYGTVNIDKEACTLCLSCVSLCPVGALTDGADKPAVLFQETACLQCGLCANVCPETAISLTPQLNLSKDAVSPRVLHEEEPFECISCGKPFGVKSTVERIVEKLEGQHWMYTNSDNTKLIQMCDDCRVKAQYHDDNSPFKMGEVPKTRTTQDYLDEQDKN